jgi:hypothetical protein
MVEGMLEFNANGKILVHCSDTKKTVSLHSRADASHNRRESPQLYG